MYLDGKYKKKDDDGKVGVVEETVESRQLDDILNELFENNLDIMVDFINEEEIIDEDNVDTAESVEAIDEARFKNVKRAVVTKRQRVDKLSKSSALVIAKQDNDPLYAKMLQKKKEYMDLREKIRVRNKAKSKRKAVDFIAHRNVNGGKKTK